MKHLLTLILFSYSSLAIAKTTLELSSDSFAHSEAFPLAIVLDGWDVPIRNGEFTQAYSHTELKLSRKIFSFSIYNRIDSQLRYANKTIRFIKSVKQNDPFSKTGEIPILLDAYQYRAHGLKFGYEKQWKKQARISFSTSIFNAYDLTYGQLFGKSTIISPNDYKLDLAVDYWYSKDFLFDRKSQRPDGLGFSTDLDLNIQLASNLEINMKITDLLGMIRWDSTPRTNATLNLGEEKYTAEGFRIYEPALNGKETTEKFSMKVRPRYFLGVKKKFSQNILSASILRTHLQSYYNVSTILPVFSNSQIKLGTELVTSSLIVGIQSSNFSIEVQSDNVNYRKSHFGAINFHYAKYF